MSAVAGFTCPECGRVGRSERAMHRSRRRWGWVVVGAVMLMTATAASVTPKVRRDGGWSIAPTWVVLMVEKRVGVDSWEALSAERHKRFEEGAFSDGQARDIVNLEGLIRMREVWPRGAKVRAWWNRGSFVGMYYGPSRAATEPVGIEPVLASVDDSAMSPDTWVNAWNDGEHLMTLAPDGRSVEFAVTLPMKNSGVVVREPIRWVTTMDEAMTPVRGEEIDEAVKKGLRAEMVTLDGTAEKLVLLVDSARDGALADVTLGVRAEVMFDGQVVASARWCREPKRAAHTRGGPYAPLIQIRIVVDEEQPLTGGALKRFQNATVVMLEGDLARVLTADVKDPRWTVRFVGDGEMALRDVEGTRYWDGSFESPLGEVIGGKASGTGH